MPGCWDAGMLCWRWARLGDATGGFNVETRERGGQRPETEDQFVNKDQLACEDQIFHGDQKSVSIQIPDVLRRPKVSQFAETKGQSVSRDQRPKTRE